MKKYLLFIVEGKNDRRELQAIIRAACGTTFLDNYVDAYHVHNGDITTEANSSEKTIIKKLNDIVSAWRKGGESPYQKIPTSDVARIIHIIDTDGVFIPESSIIQTDDGKVQYFDQQIHYLDRSIIIGRNRKKAKVIRRLLETKTIDNIPYQVLFASCNMDHVLFNDRNPLPKDKDANSFDFARKCTNALFLQDNVFVKGVCAEGTYHDSWEMIQSGYNSLARHTNLNILLKDLNS